MLLSHYIYRMQLKSPYMTIEQIRVYGALALITCLKRKERLPKRHSPVWSTTLQGSIVCFSGIEMKIRVYFLFFFGLLSAIFNLNFVSCSYT